MGAFNTQKVRKEKNKRANQKEQGTDAMEDQSLPSDRRAYAEANKNRAFPAMPPPLNCTAAQIFYRGQSDRINERAEKSFQERLQEAREDGECTQRIERSRP